MSYKSMTPHHQATHLAVEHQTLSEQTFGGGRQQPGEAGSDPLASYQNRERAAALAPAEPIARSHTENVGPVRLQVEDVHTADHRHAHLEMIA